MLETVVSPPQLLDKSQSTQEKQILKVFYKDNTFKSYNLPVDVQSADVCAKFATKFLRISERAASHFSLHLVIQGKVVKQLKPTDKPIKIQKELSTLGYKFNATHSDENYFLFSISDETKSKMNDYCERNSVMLRSPVGERDQRPTTPRGGIAGRAQTMTKSAKEKFDSIRRKMKKDTTPTRDEAPTGRKRSSAPPHLSQRLSSPPSIPPSPQPSTTQPPQFFSPQISTARSYPVTPGEVHTPTGQSTPGGDEPPTSLVQSWSPDTPLRRQTLLSPRIPSVRLPMPPSPKLQSPPSSPFRGNLPTPTRSAEEDLETVISSLFGGTTREVNDDDDVGKMMDGLFDWYPASSATPTPAQQEGQQPPQQQHQSEPQPTLDGEDDFNEILDALHQLSNA